MQEYFNTLADFIGKQLQGKEIYLAELTAEQSDFIRFNKAQILQPGSIEQRYLIIDLIDGQRHISEQLALSGELKTDYERITVSIRQLRDQLSQVPEDPYLLYATEVNSTESIGNNNLLDAKDAVNEILTAGGDFVGIYASGGIFTGFANSFGQRNWHSSYTFNLDWSLYHSKDKAVKSSYAGFNWDNAEFQRKITNSTTQLEILKREPKNIKPGKYRVYLSPAALFEIFQLLSWDSFGIKSHRTKDTALLRMLEGQNLHPDITITENIKDGTAPAFQTQGFIKPKQVSLIKQGSYNEALISPRSAQEYAVDTNGANDEEFPTSLDLAAGYFANDILKELGTGIYINNLWYLNYSDKPAGRMTGMTRFATFWVENGEIVAPLNVMRWDETIYNILGDKLIALTKKREFIMEADTYEVRSTNSARLPGALLEDFIFTF